MLWTIRGFPGGAGGKESAYQSRRCWLGPWVRKILWRRAWHPPPVSLPGESHGQGSLVGYSSWGRKELDTTEQVNDNDKSSILGKRLLGREGKILADLGAVLIMG